MPKDDTIIIDFGSGIFRDFDIACEWAVKVFGFEGNEWSRVSESKDFKQLARYLHDQEVHAYTV